MKLKLLGKYLIIISSILTPIDVFLINQKYWPSFTWEILSLTFLLITFNLGLAFLYLEVDAVKRKSRAKVFLIISFLLWLLGLNFKVNHWFGANALVIVGSFMFAFAYLPLLVKSRYEKWKNFTSSNIQTLTVSLADLLSLMLILTGFLFKFMHWPFAFLLIIIGSILLVISFLGWNQIFKSSIQLRKKAEEELQNAFGELKEKHLIIEEKNKEITDSINYAKRIQTAILPSENDFISLFKDAFILFKPKDIVSGDFYWITKKQNYIFYATADCTGHGVPGGFMSMLGCSFLNEIIVEKNIDEPAEILNQLRDRVISSLKQSDLVGENKDGMDIVLIRIDIQRNELTHASANNEFYIIRDKEMLFFKPNKQPIGFYNSEMVPFNQHIFQLKEGDCIYTFTDGYADQFGGEKGKKLKYKNLESILLQNHLHSFSEQNKIYDSFIESWKGDLEQNDDICVIGIRI